MKNIRLESDYYYDKADALKPVLYRKIRTPKSIVEIEKNNE